MSVKLIFLLSDVSIKVPNSDCSKECIPPQQELTKGTNYKLKPSKNLPWPPTNWPTCE